MEKIFLLTYILRIGASQFLRKAPVSLREGVGHFFFVWVEGMLSVEQAAMDDAACTTGRIWDKLLDR
jgi:hypothetical protein